MSIDAETRRRASVTSPRLSGPAIKPIALRMVYETARAVSIPIIGMAALRLRKTWSNICCWRHSRRGWHGQLCRPRAVESIARASILVPRPRVERVASLTGALEIARD